MRILIYISTWMLLNLGFRYIEESFEDKYLYSLQYLSEEAMTTLCISAVCVSRFVVQKLSSFLFILLQIYTSNIYLQFPMVVKHICNVYHKKTQYIGQTTKSDTEKRNEDLYRLYNTKKIGDRSSTGMEGEGCQAEERRPGVKGCRHGRRASRKNTRRITDISSYILLWDHWSQGDKKENFE